MSAGETRGRMAQQQYANVWSHMAAGLTAVAHTRAGVIRWLVLIALSVAWIGGGMVLWWGLGPWEALYRTISAVSMWDEYFNVHDSDVLRDVVRFSAIATPAVSLLFAFSGQLGRGLARIFNLGAVRHIVIAGDNPAALSLALDCRKAHDAVILIAEDISDETALHNRRKGFIVLEGEATQTETLRSARAHFASHVVAFEPDDTANLQIEAAVRRLVGGARRRPPIGVHVATRSPLLLKEAREMRSSQMRRMGKEGFNNIDPKPFSLEEIAARALLQREAQTLLSVTAAQNLDRVHLLVFGFDEAAEGVAAYLLKSLWSAKFEPPRVTVLTQNPEAAEGRFRARHREAFAHPELWVADIAFRAFDWDAASIGHEVLDEIEAARGKPSAALISTGSDPGNIALSIALKRASNNRLRWPIPIYMKEANQSEFSKEYAHGDDTPDVFDAYLQAFGAREETATRRTIIEGGLDRGAAIAHEHYSRGLAKKDAMSMRELQAAMRDWGEVLETYRAANRAVADSALVKMWDAGWKPAAKGVRGETAPQIPPELIEPLARREHDRWVAERLMSGWRPTGSGETRDNELMSHDKLVGWDALNADDRENDVVQVRAAIDIARLMYPGGFVPLG